MSVGGLLFGLKGFFLFVVCSLDVSTLGIYIT